MTLLTSTQFFSFLGAAMLVTVSPGPDNLMVLSIGASRGRIRGMAFGLGCAIGCLSHTLLAALGVSALIKASPVSFTVLKVLGGLYLIYMGWRALKSRGGAHVDPAAQRNGESALNSDGVGDLKGIRDPVFFTRISGTYRRVYAG